MTGITDVPGVAVGHATDGQGMTGCTVVLVDGDGAVVGVEVAGHASGTRELDLCRPDRLVHRCQAVLLTGGSAFGLDAAAGVVRWLEAAGRGYVTPFGRVPIVPAAVLYDLGVGDAGARPDGDMGEAACRAASAGPVAEGNVGAGTGASVGKMLGREAAHKSGVGTWSVTLPGGGVVGALVAVNAVGDVRDPATGVLVAGARGRGGQLVDSGAWLLRSGRTEVMAPANTTIACVATDVALDPGPATIVARMAAAALARTISPAFTPFDGDTVFALSCGDRQAELVTVGHAAAEALTQAVLRAVRLAAPAGGLPGLG